MLPLSYFSLLVSLTYHRHRYEDYYYYHSYQMQSLKVTSTHSHLLQISHTQISIVNPVLYHFSPKEHIFQAQSTVAQEDLFRYSIQYCSLLSNVIDTESRNALSPNEINFKPGRSTYYYTEYYTYLESQRNCNRNYMTLFRLFQF